MNQPRLNNFRFVEPGIKFLETVLRLICALVDHNDFVQTCDLPPILFVYGSVLIVAIADITCPILFVGLWLISSINRALVYLTDYL